MAISIRSGENSNFRTGRFERAVHSETRATTITGLVCWRNNIDGLACRHMGDELADADADDGDEDDVVQQQQQYLGADQGQSRPTPSTCFYVHTTHCIYSLRTTFFSIKHLTMSGTSSSIMVISSDGP